MCGVRYSRGERGQSFFQPVPVEQIESGQAVIGKIVAGVFHSFLRATLSDYISFLTQIPSPRFFPLFPPNYLFRTQFNAPSAPTCPLSSI